MIFLKNFFLGTTQAKIITLLVCTTIAMIIFLGISFHHSQTSSKIVWSAFDGGGERNVVNNFETFITMNDVGNLKLIWQKSLPYKTNGSPAEVPNVQTSSGMKDIIFITTQKGSLVALDAATGTKIWQTNTTGNFVGGQGTSS